MKRLGIQLLTMFVTIGGTLLILNSENSTQILEFLVKNQAVLYIVLIVAIFAIVNGVKYVGKSKKEKYISKVDTSHISQDFEKLYATLYSLCIGELESLRKKVRLRQVIQYVLYFALIVGYIFSQEEIVIINPSTDSIIAIVGVLLGLIGVALTYFNMKYTKNYKQTYKQKVISSFVKLVDNNLVLAQQANGNSANEEYKTANFDNKTYNRFSVSDQIDGSIEGNNIKVWDIDIKKRLVVEKIEIRKTYFREYLLWQSLLII